MKPFIAPSSPRLRSLRVPLLLALLIWNHPAPAAAAAPRPPVGRWQIQVTENAHNQYFRGPITYTFDINLKAGGIGSTTAGLEYQGTEVNAGTLKGSKHVKAVMSRPISNATFDGTKLLLYSGGDFRLVTADPPGHTIKDYATAGGLFPSAPIDKMLESFYGVMVFTVDGDSLIFVGKKDGGTKLVWKKIR